MEENTKCKNTAQFLVPWGGRQLKCCKQHAENMTTLGRVMGVPVQVAEVPMSDQCTMQDDLQEQTN